MTDWQERREFEERLAQGEGITVVEAQQLIHDVDDAERFEALYKGLRKALKDAYGIVAVETTTDDDEEAVIELVESGDLSDPLESAIRRG